MKSPDMFIFLHFKAKGIAGTDVEFLSFLHNSNPISVPFNFNDLFDSNRHKSGYVDFLVFLGHKNHISQTFYFL